ncbi:MAG: PDZ domain-containing protein [Fibrobacter sp.]|nr:PDZ domain-containing protein [Fibrobacter sp.]
MNLFKSFVLPSAIALSTGLALWSCSPESSEQIFYPITGGEDMSLPEYELLFNYEMLNLLYLYAHQGENGGAGELYAFEDYQGAGMLLTDDYSYCTQEYGNVCYMYHQMSDKFTRYFDPNYAERIYKLIMESDDAIGIGASVTEIKLEDGTIHLVVENVYSDGPADIAKLAVGDTILSVNGIQVYSQDEFEYMTEGEKGEQIILEIANKPSVVITIDVYKSPTVFLSYKDGIPVIKITEFTGETINGGGTYDEFIEVLKKIKDTNKSAIIDLRDNGGGSTDQCHAMAAELLSKGDTILIDEETNIDSQFVRGQWDYFQIIENTTYTAEKDGIGKDLYYVFLANAKTASCSEAMLSAVTVNKKTPVVGLTTYGKGIGQAVVVTKYAAEGLALITALRSRDKNGDIYHKMGIVPDYAIYSPQAQMEKALELAKSATETRTMGYGTVPTGNFDKLAAISNKMPSNRQELLESLPGKYSVRKIDIKK